MKLKDVLDKELKDGPKRKLYDMTGKADTRKLVQLTGMSAGAISELWQEWYTMGIVTKRGRYYYKLFGDEDGSQ